MGKVRIAGLLVAGMTLSLSPHGFSQGTGGTAGTNPGLSAPPVPQQGPGYDQAPIGHRQPTAQDVPRNESSTIDAMDKSDKELDRKLNICRGC